MIFNRFSQLFHQASEDGVLSDPLPESAFHMSAADRRWLWMAGTSFWWAIVIFTVVGLAILAQSMAGLNALLNRMGLSDFVAFVFIVLLTLLLSFLGIAILEKTSRLVTRRYVWLKRSTQDNLWLCSPLSKGDCSTMLNLFRTIEGGQDYHRKILNEGRTVYGFDLELLERVQAVQFRHAEKVEEQRQREQEARRDEAACKAIHGIV